MLPINRIVISVIFANCFLPAHGGENALSGTLSLSGAWAMYPTVVAWVEAFKIQNPGLRINVSAGGAGKGAADAIAGAVDIGMVSRDPDSAELKRGIQAIYVLHDAVFPIVNNKNPELKAILSRGLSQKKWMDLFITGIKPTLATLVNGTTAKPPHIYTRSDACGAASSWAKYLGSQQEDLHGIGISSDPDMLDAVRKDILGIGYVNFSYAFDRTGKISAGISIVPIDRNENSISDSSEIVIDRTSAINVIESGIYPVSRKNYFFVKSPISIIERVFIQFALSDSGTAIVEKIGASLPLKAGQRLKILAALN